MLWLLLGSTTSVLLGLLVTLGVLIRITRHLEGVQATARTVTTEARTAAIPRTSTGL